MTTNQLKYAEHRENQRHNLEMEKQGKTKLDQDYYIGTGSLANAARSAAAAMRSANAAEANAEVRNRELRQRIYEYESSGKELQDSQAHKNEADATGKDISNILDLHLLPTNYQAGLYVDDQARANLSSTQYGTVKTGIDAMTKPFITIGDLVGAVLGKKK